MTKREERSGPHRYREELDESTHRELKIQFLEKQSTIGAYTVCRKAGLPIVAVAGDFFLNLDRCWCPEPHLVDRSIYEADQLMRIAGDRVVCQKHETQWSIRQLLDKLPLGKRKSVAKTDALLATIAWNPKPGRYYVFCSGEGMSQQQVISDDPAQALRETFPDPRHPLRGVVIEAATIQRAREIADTEADELPWREGLEKLLRDDLTLPPNWHNTSLTEREQTILRDQETQAASERRKARLKLIQQMKNDADRLSF